MMTLCLYFRQANHANERALKKNEGLRGINIFETLVFIWAGGPNSKKGANLLVQHQVSPTLLGSFGNGCHGARCNLSCWEGNP